MTTWLYKTKHTSSGHIIHGDSTSCQTYQITMVFTAGMMNEAINILLLSHYIDCKDQRSVVTDNRLHKPTTLCPYLSLSLSRAQQVPHVCSLSFYLDSQDITSHNIQIKSHDVWMGIRHQLDFFPHSLYILTKNVVHLKINIVSSFKPFTHIGFVSTQ